MIRLNKILSKKVMEPSCVNLDINFGLFLTNCFFLLFKNVEK